MVLLGLVRSVVRVMLAHVTEEVTDRVTLLQSRCRSPGPLLPLPTDNSFADLLAERKSNLKISCVDLFALVYLGSFSSLDALDDFTEVVVVLLEGGPDVLIYSATAT